MTDDFITIDSEEQLDDLLSCPLPETVEFLRELEGDVLLIGAGGKMGPTLARMLRRGLEAAGRMNRVYAASRYGSVGVREILEKDGIITIPCDAIDAEQLVRLPDARSIIYLAGRKFGSAGNEPLTWALNSFMPGMVMQRFPRARIVALSTGNVYPFVSTGSRGSKESDNPQPIGEYAQSCLGRERIIQYWSMRQRIPATIVRLNYAVEMRYGILIDIAKKVWFGQPIDLRMGYINVIWQGDANNGIIQALACCGVPPFLINCTGAEILSVRHIAEEFAGFFGKEARCTGVEEETALLSDATVFHKRFPFRRVSSSTLIRWTAHWIRRGGATWDKPTNYEVRNGVF